MARVAGFLRRWRLRQAEYWKSMADDYKTVFVDAFNDSKKKPLKTAVIGAGLGTLLYAYKTNPTESDLLNAIRERRHEMVLLPNPIHSPQADRALVRRTLYLDQHRLDHIDCFFFSLALRRRHDRYVQTYLSQDSNIRDSWWRELWAAIVDVGAFGRWFNLDKSFEQFDINEEEFNSADSDVAAS